MALYDFTYRFEKRHPKWWSNVSANLWQFTLKGYVVLIPPFIALWYARLRVFANSPPPQFPFVDNPLVSVAAQHGGIYYNSPFGTSFHNWLVCTLTATKVIGKYLWLLVWPQNLSCDYSYDQIPLVDLTFKRFSDWGAVLALVLVLAAIAVAVRHYHRNKAVFFFIMFFFLTLLPVSNLVIVTGSIMAERFMYLPMIGFAGCAVMAVDALARRIAPLRSHAMLLSCGALSMLVLACGIRAFIRNSDWQDDIALFTSAVKVCPDSYKTHKDLAFAFYRRHEEKHDLADIELAIQEGQKALAVMEAKPLPSVYQTSLPYVHLGAYYQIKGDILAQRTEDGRPWYEKSIGVLTSAIPLDRAFNDDNRTKELARGRTSDEVADTGSTDLYFRLGLSYARLGQYPEALTAFFYLRHLAPTNSDAYANIGSIYMLTGHTRDAVLALLQAAILDGNRTDVRRMLVDLYRRIDTQGCAVIPAAGKALPRINAACPPVHNDICSAHHGLVRVFLDAKQYGLAREAEALASSSYGCEEERPSRASPN